MQNVRSGDKKSVRIMGSVYEITVRSVKRLAQ
jgi:hypothetical protein